MRQPLRGLTFMLWSRRSPAVRNGAASAGVLQHDPAPKPQLADQGRSLKGAQLAQPGIGTNRRRPHVLADQRAVALLNPTQELSHLYVPQLRRHLEHDRGGQRARVVDALGYTPAKQDLDGALLDQHGLVVPLDL